MLAVLENPVAAAPSRLGGEVAEEIGAAESPDDAHALAGGLEGPSQRVADRRGPPAARLARAVVLDVDHAGGGDRAARPLRAAVGKGGQVGIIAHAGRDRRLAERAAAPLAVGENPDDSGHLDAVAQLLSKADRAQLDDGDEHELSAAVAQPPPVTGQQVEVAARDDIAALVVVRAHREHRQLFRLRRSVHPARCRVLEGRRRCLGGRRLGVTGGGEKHEDGDEDRPQGAQRRTLQVPTRKRRTSAAPSNCFPGRATRVSPSRSEMPGSSISSI